MRHYEEVVGNVLTETLGDGRRWIFISLTSQKLTGIEEKGIPPSSPGAPELLPCQRGHINPPANSGSALGILLSGTRLNNL